MYAVRNLMSGVTTNTTSAPIELDLHHDYPNFLVQATVAGTGAVSVTVTIQGSLDKVNWVTVGSALSLSGTTSATDKVTSTECWAYLQAITASITGTGAAVTVNVAQ